MFSRRFWDTVLGYVGGYLIGILASLICTPASLLLAGVFLLPIYVIGALPGYIVWFVLLFNAPNELAWPWLSIVALAPLYCEWRLWRAKGNETLAARLVAWRPIWIAFPIGFLGTVSIFSAAVGTI